MLSFKPSHSIRQSEFPFSIFVILCMEKLSIAINNVVHQGSWDLIHISTNGPKLSHFLFADDVLFFTKATKSQLTLTTQLFDRFSKSSDLKINLFKSHAFFHQVRLKLKSTCLLPLLILEARPPWINIWVFLFSKGELKEVISILSKKKCNPS
jgi:hypothetical protein